MIDLFLHNLWIGLAPAHAKHEATIRGGKQLRRRCDHPGFQSAGRARDMVFADYPGRRDGTSVGHGPGSRRTAKEAMGVDWMKNDEACQAIPPAYSQHIGEYALMALGRSSHEPA